MKEHISWCVLKASTKSSHSLDDGPICGFVTPNHRLDITESQKRTDKSKQIPANYIEMEKSTDLFHWLPENTLFNTNAVYKRAKKIAEGIISEKKNFLPDALWLDRIRKRTILLFCAYYLY